MSDNPITYQGHTYTHRNIWRLIRRLNHDGYDVQLWLWAAFTPAHKATCKVQHRMATKVVHRQDGPTPWRALCAAMQAAGAAE